jgi:hypothetical protein
MTQEDRDQTGYTTSITQNVEQYFREAVRSIPITEHDLDADGDLTDEAIERIVGLAVHLVCQADLEEADKFGTYPVCDIELFNELPVYAIANKEIRRARFPVDWTGVRKRMEEKNDREGE